MDWLRRNWPDLLIGIALLAVIAGIVATLLTGGSFFPINSGGSPSPTVTAPSVDPVAPSTDPAVPPGSVEVTPPAPGASTPDTSTPDASTPDAAADPGGDGPTAGGGGAVAVLPPTGGSDTAADDTPSSSSGTAAAGTTTTPPSGDAGDAPATSATSGASTPGAGATASGTATGNEGLPTAPYRVSVGAFGSEANAQGQAARFRDAGFPVFIGRQGDLYLVLVGPYETEGEAEQAVSRIRTGDFGIDPVIYRFQPDDEGAAGATAGPQVTADEPAPSEPAVSAPSPAPTATADGTFLQIGAYATRESALPQIERMEELGFEVTERTESGLIKLLVGPFTGADLTEARQILQDEGIEHFAR